MPADVAAGGGVLRRLGNQTGVCQLGTTIVPDWEISMRPRLPLICCGLVLLVPFRLLKVVVLGFISGYEAR